MQPTVRPCTTGCPPVRCVQDQRWCHGNDPGLIHWNILVTNILILLSVARCHPRRTASCVLAPSCPMATACATTPWMITSISPCRPLTPAKKPKRHICPRPWRMPCWTWGRSWNKPQELNCDAHQAVRVSGAALRTPTFTVILSVPRCQRLLGDVDSLSSHLEQAYWAAVGNLCFRSIANDQAL